MKKIFIPLMTITVVVALLFGGCLPAPEVVPPVEPVVPPVEPVTPPVTPPPEAPPGAPAVWPQLETPVRDIRISTISSLSGGFAAFGIKYKIAAQVAVDQINELGGIKNLGGANIELFFGDDGGTPDQAAAEAERLIMREKVDAVIATWPTSMPVSDIAERYKTPYIAAISSPPELVERGYEYIFRICGSAEQEGKRNVYQIMKSAEECGLPPPKTMFIEGISDDCAVADMYYVALEAEKAGIEIIGREIVEWSDPTFVPMLIKIEALKPDVLYSCHYTPDAITLYREMMERETYFPYGISSWGGGIEDPLFYEALPLRAYEYGWCEENGDSVPQFRPWYPYINSKIQPIYGRPWADGHMVANYSTVWILKEALERTVWSDDQATFRTNLRNALDELSLTPENAEKFTTPDGTVYSPAIDPILFSAIGGLDFGENGQAIQEIGLMSQNLAGTRWPMFPEHFRLPNQPGPVLPIPPWDER